MQRKHRKEHEDEIEKSAIKSDVEGIPCPKEFLSKIKPFKTTRRYDIVDMLIITLFDAIVFSAGLGMGYLLWFK